MAGVAVLAAIAIIAVLFGSGLIPGLRAGVSSNQKSPKPTAERTDKPAAEQTAKPAEVRQIIDFRGEGIGQSEPFTLTKSQAAIAWLAKDNSGFSCYFGASIVPLGQEEFMGDLFANQVIDASSSDDGKYFFYGGPGTYYLSVNSTCSFYGVGVFE